MLSARLFRAGGPSERGVLCGRTQAVMQHLLGLLGIRDAVPPVVLLVLFGALASLISLSMSRARMRNWELLVISLKHVTGLR